MYGADSGTFRPDFLFWGENNVWAIDPKGKHLLEGALATKMLDINEAGIRIALILDGSYDKSGDTWVRARGDGFTLIRKYLGGIKSKKFTTLTNLLSELD